MSGPAHVELITRPECSLCDDARVVLARWSRRLGVTVVEMDVAGDRATLSARIPVVRAPGGRIIDEGRVSGGRVALGMAMVRLAALAGLYNRPK